jgi:hypothetical protein
MMIRQIAVSAAVLVALAVGSAEAISELGVLGRVHTLESIIENESGDSCTCVVGVVTEQDVLGRPYMRLATATEEPDSYLALGGTYVGTNRVTTTEDYPVLHTGGPGCIGATCYVTVIEVKSAICTVQGIVPYVGTKVAVTTCDLAVVPE